MPPIFATVMSLVLFGQPATDVHTKEVVKEATKEVVKDAQTAKDAAQDATQHASSATSAAWITAILALISGAITIGQAINTRIREREKNESDIRHAELELKHKELEANQQVLRMQHDSTLKELKKENKECQEDRTAIKRDMQEVKSEIKDCHDERAKIVSTMDSKIEEKVSEKVLALINKRRTEMNSGG